MCWTMGPSDLSSSRKCDLCSRKYFRRGCECAVLNGANPEIDVRVLKDGESVLFHDQSMLRTTGKDKQISEVDIAEALSTSILEEIDGHNYTFTNSIPKLETVVEAICNADKNIGIDLDTKTRVAAKAGVKAIKNN
eukprot:361189_1